MNAIKLIVAAWIVCLPADYSFSEFNPGGNNRALICLEEKSEGDLMNEFRQMYNDKRFRRITEAREQADRQKKEKEEMARDPLGEKPAPEEESEKIIISPLYGNSINTGFDDYPVRSYYFLFNNVLSSFYYRPGSLLYLIPVPAGTIQSARTLESGYSMLLRLSDYPVNLLYGKIGIGWTALLKVIKTALLDFPFARTMTVLNHEYSGHAIRGMEAKEKMKRITIGPPLPYGSGGGATQLSIPTGVDQCLMITTAGSEASMVMTHEMTLRLVAGRSIYPFDVLLYLSARFDPLFYINLSTRTPSGLRLFSQGDFENYLVLVNNKYGRVFPHTYYLKYHDIRQWSFIALADPFLYMSAGAYLYGLITGKRLMETLMIPLGREAGMMPSTRVSYTPNGPECSVDLFFSLPRRTVVVVYARGGSRKLRGTSGAGIHLETTELSRRVELGGGVDLFSQPGVTYNPSTFYLENVLFRLYPWIDYPRYYASLVLIDIFNGYASRHRSRIAGFSLYFDLNAKVNDFFKLCFRVGYKTEGYVQGLALARGIFWHAGMGFIF